MKAINERLEWVTMYFNRSLNNIPTGLDIAREELMCCIAIAEVVGMKGLSDRLETVRLFLIGTETDRDKAFNALLEAVAISDALPEIKLELPEPPPAGFV